MTGPKSPEPEIETFDESDVVEIEASESGTIDLSPFLPPESKTKTARYKVRQRAGSNGH